MIENQKTISEWATKTFGYLTLNRSIERMLEEVEELKKINIDTGTGTNKSTEALFDKVTDECADVLITLYQVANVFGFDLHICVDHKMSINRARKWKIVGDGTGQHIKEE